MKIEQNQNRAKESNNTGTKQYSRNQMSKTVRFTGTVQVPLKS